MALFFKHKKYLLLLSLDIIIYSFCFSQTDKHDTLSFQSRTLINLLDYISQDYSKAVRDGKVINIDEYNEMLDFTAQSISLFDSVSQKISFSDKQKLTQQFSELQNSINQKHSKEVIGFKAQQIKKQLLLRNIIDISPEQYPDISKGKNIFVANCQSCHGTYGAADGPLSNSFTPHPANFQDDSLMEQISPLQVFNTARLGIQGTGMRAFDELSDSQLWEVSFYIKSLRFQNKFSFDSTENFFNNVNLSVTLADVAHLSDKELRDKLGATQSDSAIAFIRLHQPSTNQNSALSIALSNLDDALMFYKNGDALAAESKALDAYLDGIDPVEQQLAAIDNSIVPELENQMNQLRSAIKSRKSPAVVEQKIADAKNSIAKASQLLGEQTYSFWFSFLIAASILLREGLEAVLIIITILSLLKSLEANKAIKWVHGGWLAALAIGVASWFFTGWLISFGSQNREVIEGIGAIFAVIILMYVGFWLHNKTEARKWQEFIHTKITNLLDNEKMFGLGFISFIVVFREAFESVLFLSSMQLQVDDSSRNGIWMGALAAIIAVILFGYALLRFAVRIPLRKLFQYSAIIIMILAIVLAGQGIHAFQESGWLSVNSFPLNFHLPLLGIYPTVETFLAQLIILLATVILWYYQKAKIYKGIKV